MSILAFIILVNAIKSFEFSLKINQ